MNAPRPPRPARPRPASAGTGDRSGPLPDAAATDRSPRPKLSSAQRSTLRADAHHLDPVVMIGDSGLSAAVLSETDRALGAHQLIKIRVLGDDREARARMMAELCAALGCAPVQMIGKLLVVWRPVAVKPHVEDFVPKKEAAQRAAARQAAAPAPGRPKRAVTTPERATGERRRAPKPETPRAPRPATRGVARSAVGARQSRPASSAGTRRNASDAAPPRAGAKTRSVRPKSGATQPTRAQGSAPARTRSGPTQRPGRRPPPRKR